MSLSDYIEQLASGQPLSADDMQSAMEQMVSGEANTEEMAQFLTTQSEQGITAEALDGAVTALLSHMVSFTLPDSMSQDDIVDCCGTGGDGKDTLNVSTAAAFVVAGCSVPVVKHGNKAVSSKSGSSDVLSELGVNVMVEPEVMQHALAEANICFLMAPRYHPAMKHVAPVRAQLKTRTIFNLLGPLVNPARPRRQLIGVYDAKWCPVFAEVLARHDALRALVVNSHDGYDELTTAGNTVSSVTRGTVTHEADLVAGGKSLSIAGGDAAHNAAALRALLTPGTDAGDYRTAVLLNSAAVLLVAEKTDSVERATVMAAESINSGRALAALDTLVEITSG